MFKILERRGNMRGHEGIQIYRLEELGFVAVNFERADGTNMEAWKCDESGYEINPNEQSMLLRSVNEPISYDEDGSPEDFELIGFELN